MRAASRAIAASSVGTATNVMRIARRDARQQRSHESRHREGHRRARARGRSSVSACLAQHHPQQIARRRAQRQPDAHLLRALADRVGDHAVESDGGQHQRQHAHHAEQVRAHALREDRRPHVLLQRPRVEDRQVGVEAANDVARIAARTAPGAPALRTCRTTALVKFCSSGRYMCGSRRSAS